MKVVTSPLLKKIDGVRHAFFTRHGGVSRGVYDSLNVGRGSKDRPEDVAENQRRCATYFGQPAARLVTCHQIHSRRVLGVDAPFTDARPQADGTVTARPHLVLGALSADCAPVLLVDPRARVIGAVHAGWRGALGGAIDEALIVMQDSGAHLPDIVAAVGPCIGQASYEVGLEFADRFVADDPANQRFFAPGKTAEKRQFDLPGYVLARLGSAGVTQAEWVGVDTCADEDFFSNRRAVLRREPDYGRLLSAIMLEERG